MRGFVVREMNESAQKMYIRQKKDVQAKVKEFESDRRFVCMTRKGRLVSKPLREESGELSPLTQKKILSITFSNFNGL